MAALNYNLYPHGHPLPAVGGTHTWNGSTLVRVGNLFADVQAEAQTENAEEVMEVVEAPVIPVFPRGNRA